jgi:hypothetical protein
MFKHSPVPVTVTFCPVVNGPPGVPTAAAGVVLARAVTDADGVADVLAAAVAVVDGAVAALLLPLPPVSFSTPRTTPMATMAATMIAAGIYQKSITRRWP